jgi:DNA-binding transcriptional regulator YhcF (GntR family)
MSTVIPDLKELDEQPLIVTIGGDKYTVPAKHLNELESKYESLTSSKLKKLVKKLSI